MISEKKLLFMTALNRIALLFLDIFVNESERLLSCRFAKSKMQHENFVASIFTFPGF